MFTSIQDLVSVHELISPYIHRTPVMSSSAFNEAAGCTVFFKCENFQKMGAFKMRGAMNAVLALNAEQRGRGIITHSSGNFAQATALAARNIGIRATIVMPSNTPEIKKTAVRGYSAEIVECEPTNEAHEAVTDEDCD